MQSRKFVIKAMYLLIWTFKKGKNQKLLLRRIAADVTAVAEITALSINVTTDNCIHILDSRMFSQRLYDNMLHKTESTSTSRNREIRDKNNKSTKAVKNN